jgi:predicted enzyme related to lactoylglutathione lyase
MAGVTGIGGIFFKCRDPQALGQWYQRHLGLALQDWGGVVFPWASADNPAGVGSTLWTPMPADSSYFAPSQAGFMVNFRVDDLPALLAALRAAGCAVDDKTESSEFGQFAWVQDPEGNRVELWQPPPGR